MSSNAIGQEECEIEDIVGEETILPVLTDLVGTEVQLDEEAGVQESLVRRIRKAVAQHGVELPEGWKQEVARRIVVAWTTMEPKDIPGDVTRRAEMLFGELTKRFERNVP